MSVHFKRETEKLKKKILTIGAMVEENVKKAIDHIANNNDDEVIKEVKKLDDKIDQYEVDVEEECLKILALYQPVANDLRYIIAVLKINNDLERVSDHAVNIVKQTRHLRKKYHDDLNVDFTVMGEKVIIMLKDSLDALIGLDAELARKVREADDEVDEIHKKMYSEIEKIIKKDKDATGYMMNVMQISRNLERIADLATNIAEDVIYLIEGRIVRHGMDVVEESE